MLCTGIVLLLSHTMALLAEGDAQQRQQSARSANSSSTAERQTKDKLSGNQTRQTGDTSATTQPLPATEQMVFFGAARPILVRVVVLIDDEEIRTAREARIDRVFGESDLDKNGVLNEEERKAGWRAPWKLGLRGAWDQHVGTMDNMPQDGQITRSEMADYVHLVAGAPVQLFGRNRSSQQAVELFDLLDADSDMQLTEKELNALPVRLHKLDEDGDEAFSVVEVEPFRNPFAPRQAAPRKPEETPWGMRGEVDRILKRFDREPKSRDLDTDEIGISKEKLQPFDLDRNGALNQSELAAFLKTASDEFELVANLYASKSGRAQISWKPLPEKPQTARVRPEPPARVLEVTVDKLPLRLQVSSYRTAQRDNLDLYKLRFLQNDRDKNKYLDPAEFAVLSIPNATFEMVDTDNDKQIFQKEMIEFLNLVALGSQAQATITYDSSEQSLFALLDTNKDRRLTPREWIYSKSRWQSRDFNQDGILQRSELSGEYRLTIELPRPESLQINSNATEGSREAVVFDTTSGPEWFIALDRNRDRDVTLREFLASEDLFRQWDLDQDGLLSVAEAEKVVTEESKSEVKCENRGDVDDTNFRSTKTQ